MVFSGNSTEEIKELHPNVTEGWTEEEQMIQSTQGFGVLACWQEAETLLVFWGPVSLKIVSKVSTRQHPCSCYSFMAFKWI